MLASNCAKSAHQTGQAQLEKLIPAELMAKIDGTVSFADLRSAPTNYVGRTVMLSGLALNTSLVKDGTEIEILQLPTVRGVTAADRKAESEGRFLAVQSQRFLDPAVIEKNSPLTVVGEVKGARTKILDEGEYQYPVLDVKQLIDWNDLNSRDSDGYDDSDYYGRYSGAYGPPYGLYPYGYSYGRLYPYGYYGPWYGLPPTATSPPPSPPSSLPPQFHKSQ
ncbi:MAG TPA: Slp family lipoprotein [Nitrospira sp.]|nr:Slp family lipoprotein [Nitrospira sp.]